MNVTKVIAENERRLQDDPVKSPNHYTWHPSGVECIEIVRHFNFCLGGAIKYLWRCEHAGKKEQDLKKAKQLIEFELERMKEEG